MAFASDPEAKRRAEELMSYLLANQEGLEDYRRRVNVEGVDLRGLGAIESNVDKTISGRMKKRGMSWTVEGARNMLPVLTLEANGALGAATQGVWGPASPEEATRPSRRERSGGRTPGVRLVHLPILDTGVGLAKVLRRVLYPSTSL